MFITNTNCIDNFILSIISVKSGFKEISLSKELITYG